MGQFTEKKDIKQVILGIYFNLESAIFIVGIQNLPQMIL